MVDISVSQIILVKQKGSVMTVIEFPKSKNVFQAIGQYIRLGESSYRKVADLAAEGIISSKRFVVDASKVKHMRGIVQMLQDAGAEVILDPKTIELSSRRKCGGMSASTPWASEEKGTPLAPDVFTKGHGSDIFGAIARSAVEFNLSAVLAPTHFLADPNFDNWFNIDLRSCGLLRDALDKEGGAHIKIDYLVAARLADFNDQSFRSKIIEGLGEVPFENLWIRASMSSPDTSPTNAARLVRTLAGWHNLGAPIVMDYTGGITAEALISMNVVSAVAHGFGEQTSFTTTSWQEPPKKDKDSKQQGRATRVGLTALGRSFTKPELEVLLSAYGAKSALLPTDTKILPNGVEDLRNDPRRFNAAEAQRRISDIAKIPTMNRPSIFWEDRMREVVNTSKKAAKLNPKVELAKNLGVDLAKLRKRLNKQGVTSQKLRSVYETVALERIEQGTTVREINAPRTHSTQSQTGTE